MSGLQQKEDPGRLTEAACSGNPGNLASLVSDHEHQLSRLANLIVSMTPAQYQDSQPPNDSIGTHVRHVLEHYDCVFIGQEGLVDYDQRPRDHVLESSRNAALICINRLRRTLPGLKNAAVQVRYSPDKDTRKGAASIESSIERELLYLVSHTIHHMAMIAVLARWAGLNVSPEFGVTSSTRRHRLTLATADVD
ncbi:MAG: DinB family protein [Wenzhouxiangella sp.]